MTDSNAVKKVAFIGLGKMGFPMAGHLATKGYEVVVYNRTVAVAEKWLQHYQGAMASTPAEAASDVDVVLTCIGNDNDVREVYSGANGIFSAAKPATICIDHTTTSATLAEDLDAQAQTQQMHFMDAPVSGGQVGAEQGVLTIMVGGDESIFARCEPVLQSYAKSVKRVGEVGAGQRCKMVNQLCVAGVVQGLAEGLELAKRAGFDAQTILDALQQGAGSSWQMVNRTKTMMNDQFDFGFAIDWMRKDLGICIEEAARLGLDLPLAKLVDEKYAELQKKGHSRHDTSVLIKQFKQS